VTLHDVDDAARAIRDMQVRGAPLIGATAAYGMALAAHEDASDEGMETAYGRLAAARPTAVNLRWALDRMQAALRNRRPAERAPPAYAEAASIAEEDVAINHAMGEAGLPLIQAAAARRKGEPVQILTHCNAGWLATVDWGTATAPIYLAFERGVPIHVWVDETRPRTRAPRSPPGSCRTTGSPIRSSPTMWAAI